MAKTALSLVLPVSLVSLKQQTTSPSVAFWVIVVCQCFVNLSIAHTQFMNTRSTAVYGLMKKPIPSECHRIWQLRLSKYCLHLRRERESSREICCRHFGKTWFWQNFFEYGMPTNVETQMNGVWASIVHSKL